MPDRRHGKFVDLACGCVAAPLVLCGLAGVQAAEPPLPIGANLAAPSIKSSAHGYGNLAYAAFPWRDRATGKLWTKLDADGYPTEVPAAGLYSMALNRYHPAGTYRLSWAGRAEVRVDPADGAALELLEEGPGWKRYRIQPANYGSIVVMSQDAEDRVRAIRLTPEAWEAAAGPWQADWLAFAGRFEPLRLSGLVSDRAGSAATYSLLAAKAGPPIEWLAALASATDRDVWLPLPAGADAAWAKAFAEAMRPGRRLYLELGRDGPKLPADADADRRNAARAEHLRALAATVQTWRRAFAGRDVKVLAVYAEPLETDAALDELAALLAGEPQLAAGVDVLAATAHPGLGMGGRFDPPMADVPVDAVFDDLQRSWSQDVLPRLRRAGALAAAHGWALAVYSGGQHFSWYRGGFEPAEHDAVAELIGRANRDPRMEALYRRMLADWRAVPAAGPFVHDDLVANPHHVGSWGLKDTLAQPDAEAPKMRALLSPSP